MGWSVERYECGAPLLAIVHEQPKRKTDGMKLSPFGRLLKYFLKDPVIGTEDCLYLNIYVPEKAIKGKMMMISHRNLSEKVMLNCL